MCALIKLDCNSFTFLFFLPSHIHVFFIFLFFIYLTTYHISHLSLISSFSILVEVYIKCEQTLFSIELLVTFAFRISVNGQHFVLLNLMHSEVLCTTTSHHMPSNLPWAIWLLFKYPKTSLGRASLSLLNETNASHSDIPSQALHNP